MLKRKAVFLDPAKKLPSYLKIRETPFLPTELWAYISDFLPIQDLLTLRRVSSRFKSFGEKRRLIKRISSCIDYEGKLHSDRFVIKDDLELYKVATRETSDFNYDMACAIFHQAKNCFDYILPTITDFNKVLEDICQNAWYHFHANLGVVETRFRKYSRYPDFDTHCLRILQEKGIAIKEEFLFWLNCRLCIKKKIIDTFIRSDQIKYLHRCIYFNDELPIIEYLLQKGIRLIKYTTLIDTMYTNHQPISGLLQRYGLTVNWEHKKDQTISQSCSTNKHRPTWDSLITKYWSSPDMLIDEAMKNGIFYGSADENVRSSLVKMLTYNRLDKESAQILYRASWLSAEEDPSIWGMLHDLGNREYLKEILLEDSFAETSGFAQFILILYKRRDIICTEPSFARKLINSHKESCDGVSFIMFLLIRYLVSIDYPGLIDILKECKVRYIWIYMAESCARK